MTDPVQPLPSDALLTPQSIVTYACVAIGGAVILAAFILGTENLRNMALIAAVAALADTRSYWLGSAKSSSDKDARAASTTSTQGTPT